MNWTYRQPTKPGWYWCRVSYKFGGTGSKPVQVMTYKGPDDLVVNGFGDAPVRIIATAGCEWSDEPIAHPDDEAAPIRLISTAV